MNKKIYNELRIRLATMYASLLQGDLPEQQEQYMRHPVEVTYNKLRDYISLKFYDNTSGQRLTLFGIERL